MDAEIVPIQLVPHRLSPTVQKLAGHCHLSVTQRNAHTTEALMREAVQVFGKRTG